MNEDDEADEERDPLPVYKKQPQIRFVLDMEKAGYESLLFHYEGRWRKAGPAVRCNGTTALQTIIRATTIVVDWDGCGCDGLIVYVP